MIPVSRFRVPYDIAKGRPYSHLERAVLAEIAEGGSTLRSLGQALAVHERLLVESVVTLVTAGWVAVGGGQEVRFVLTSAGDVAVKSGKPPASISVAPQKPQTILLDRICGQLARPRDFRAWRKDQLTSVWSSALVLRERILRSSVDEAQVQKLLPRSAGQWVRTVGPITPQSRGSQFLVVDFDADTGAVDGIPPVWRRSLEPYVVRYARERISSSPFASQVEPTDLSAFRSRNTSSNQSWRRATPIALSAGDVLVGGAQHEEALKQAVMSANTSIVLVVPAIATIEAFLSLAVKFTDAILRGIRVDILVGLCTGSANPTGIVATVNKLGYDTDAANGRALLRTREVVTGSGASMLVYDEDTSLVAVVGDHTWTTDGEASVSVVLTEPQLCADVARAVRSLWIGRSGEVDSRWLAPAERWGSLAARAEESAALAYVREAPKVGRVSSTCELFIDDEAPVEDELGQSAATIGQTFSDEQGGDGGQRGILLHLVGSAADLISAVRETIA